MTEETTNELTDTMPLNDAVAVDTTPAPVPTGPDAHGWWRGTGRRKTAVARVRIKSGSGEFKVNNRDLDTYFCEARDLKNIRNVLEKTGTLGSVDVFVNANGGGYMGQAGAIILGLGRALLKYDTSLEPILRDNGFLTRDAREVERKKYGQPGARRRFQFSKR
tara:strand:- start:182 stop:670 length:489 start_codon:yes stop_codon:yes gene_type:complete